MVEKWPCLIHIAQSEPVISTVRGVFPVRETVAGADDSEGLIRATSIHQLVLFSIIRMCIMELW